MSRGWSWQLSTRSYSIIRAGVLSTLEKWSQMPEWSLVKETSRYLCKATSINDEKRASKSTNYIFGWNVCKCTSYRWEILASWREGGLQVPTGKGSWLITLHASSKNCFVPNALLTYQRKLSSTDYHNKMNGKVFKKWFGDQLLQSSTQTTLSLWQIPQQHGHFIVHLPLYHCEFNATELIWGNVKGHVVWNEITLKINEELCEWNYYTCEDIVMIPVNHLLLSNNLKSTMAISVSKLVYRNVYRNIYSILCRHNYYKEKDHACVVNIIVGTIITKRKDHVAYTP